MRLALQNHIGNITAHYLSNPALAYEAIDVVNEAVADSGPNIFKDAVPWYPALPDYVNAAFLAARAADPKHALLCYNDYGGEGLSSQKGAKILQLVKDMLAAGIPITCVGLQMHIHVDSAPSAADVSANIAALGALGMTVHITEMDVACPNCSPARLQAQAQLYADILSACLKNSNCKSFEFWGIYDGDTWLGENQAPLLWDAQWRAKPAFDAVLATLQAHARARSG